MRDYSRGLLAGLLIALACGAAIAIRSVPWDISASMSLALPHLVCAIIWLPFSSRAAQIAGLVVALLLLAVTAYYFLPALLHPEQAGHSGGGMFKRAWAIFVTGAVVMLSVVVGFFVSLNREKKR